MILIIASHYSYFGAIDFTQTSISFNKVFTQSIFVGKLGVNLFMLITGYFMINSKINVNKVIKLILHVSFYSILFATIFYGFRFKEFDIIVLFKSIFSVIYGQYWFATTYIILYLFIPFINKFIKSIDKLTHLKLIVLGIIVWSIIPTFAGLKSEVVGCSNLIWLFLIYIIAAYIRLYEVPYLKSYKVNFIISIISYLFIVLSVVLLDIMGTKIPVASKNSVYMLGLNRFPLFICSITLFLGFKDLKVKYNKYINIIAGTTFGIYLIHENVFIREFLWKDVFNNKNLFESSYLVTHAIFSIVIVFIICALIELIRIAFFKKFVFKYSENISNKIEFYINNIFDVDKIK